MEGGVWQLKGVGGGVEGGGMWQLKGAQGGGVMSRVPGAVRVQGSVEIL